MFAVSISLGSTSAYVSVAPAPQQTNGHSSLAPAPIKVVANSAGHRCTPVAAALTEQETLFGENAIHTYVRQPQKVIPYLFSYSAAAAASSDAAQSQGEGAAESAARFLEVVEHAVRTKYRGHCSIEEREVGEGIHRHGFAYEADGPNGESEEKFASAEDLFVQFLNYVKEHSIDGACGLSGSDSGENAKSGNGVDNKTILLTVVVPRAAFPTIAGAHGGPGARRSDAVEWLSDAVRASQLGSVSLQTTILFSDEAALLAFDSAPRTVEPPRPYFLLPPSAASEPPSSTTTTGPTLRAADKASVLVVDWGAQALCFSHLKTSGGLLVQPKTGVPFMCCTSTGGSTSTSSFYYVNDSVAVGCGGGDAMDTCLADKVAANYMIVNRRSFQSLVPNMRPLQDLVSTTSAASRASAAEARRIVSETIPSRAMRKLRLLMGDKKIALNTNPQASTVAVEMEAFYEGMDLMDSQSLSRNKFETAVTNEWQCLLHFESALVAFIRRYQHVVDAEPFNYVLLTGGMLQVPSVVQGIRRVLQSSQSAAIQAAFVRGGSGVAVLDSSSIGNGVAADELFSVGGCLSSYHQASLVGAKRKAAARLTDLQRKKKRTVGAKIQAEALREEQKALSAAWTAMTEVDAEEEEEDDETNESTAKRELSPGVEESPDNHCTETAEHALLLKRTVYLCTQPECFDSASSSSGAFLLPRTALASLFAKGSALPARVAIPLPRAESDNGEDVALYLLTGSPSTRPDDDAHADVISVHPVGTEGIRVPTAVDTEAAGRACHFVVLTLRTDVGEEGRHTVTVSVHKVTNATGEGLPDVLNPGNTTTLAEIALY